MLLLVNWDSDQSEKKKKIEKGKYYLNNLLLCKLEERIEHTLSNPEM